MFSKIVIAICVSAVVLFCSVDAGCQPGCRTRYELYRKWADETVSSGYWQCIRWGQSEFKLCPTGTKFSEPYQTCVPTKSWEEVPYYGPPSCTDDSEDACGFVDIETCPPVCAEGEVLVNGVCQLICPVGHVLINGVCEPQIECPVGHIQVENGCECPVGYISVEGVCQPALPCPAGQVLINGVCEPLAHCPGGYVIIDGACVPQSCEPGFVRIDDVCVPDPCGENGFFNPASQTCVCAMDYVNANGTCVPACVLQEEGCPCETNYEWSNGECVPMSCANGNVENGVCVCNDGYQYIGDNTCIRIVDEPFGICEGALPENMVPGPMSCKVPVCTEELWQQKTHYPTRDPTTFFKCENYFHTEVRPCAPGTCFHYIKEVCVHPVDWVNPCSS